MIAIGHLMNLDKKNNWEKNIQINKRSRDIYSAKMSY